MTADAINLPAINLLIDRELPAAADGDRNAYGRIVAACQNSITAIALAITRDVPASEDIAQEAFLSAWQHLKRLQNPASFLPWLRQITRNLAHDHLRARRHRPLDGETAELAIANAADPAPSPLHALIADAREAAAAELISALPEESREVLLLFYREGQSSQQVASLLGLSDAAVRKRLSRARQSVRADLLARFGEFAKASAPSAGFTTTLAHALGMAAPPATAKAVFSLSAMAGAKTAAKLLLGAAGSIGVAIAAALAGIWLGLRRQLRGSIDEAERLALVRSGVVSALVSITFVIVLVTLAVLPGHWAFPVLLTVAFWGILVYQSAVVQPRILARRHALEAARDPVGAAARRRRERLQCWAGAILGLVFGLGGMVYGMFRAGRF